MGAKFDKLCQSVERSVSSLSHTVTQTLQVPATKQEGYERKFESNYNQRTIYPCTDQHDRANADVDAFIKTTSALALQRQCDLSEKVSSPTMISQHADPPGMTLLLAWRYSWHLLHTLQHEYQQRNTHPVMFPVFQETIFMTILAPALRTLLKRSSIKNT